MLPAYTPFFAPNHSFPELPTDQQHASHQQSSVLTAVHRAAADAAVCCCILVCCLGRDMPVTLPYAWKCPTCDTIKELDKIRYTRWVNCLEISCSNCDHEESVTVVRSVQIALSGATTFLNRRHLSLLMKSELHLAGRLRCVHFFNADDWH